jgi:hypothetical protein
MPSTLVQLEIKNALVKAKLTADATLTEYGDHVDNVALTTTAATSLFKAVSGNSKATLGDPDETIVLNIAQSLKAGSLWLFLRANHGKEGMVEIMPKGGAAPKIAANVTFQAPGTLGGAVGGGVSGATILVHGMATITPEP